ncbi:MAG: bifunctional ornithine acetyltransferase/N-acetylglutamate synthase [Candidatus Syntropharchaeia archaeon]
MKIIEGGVCAVDDVKAWGVKEGRNGLAVIVGRGNASGVFTRNKFRAAPLILTERNLRKGFLNAIIANSGCANSFTREEGISRAKKMAELLADFLKIDPETVGVASTGVIGRQIDMGVIERQFKMVMKNLSSSPDGSRHAAEAITTTDTFPKEFAVEIEGVRIGGIAKGAGMIAPNMATMLSFIYTDADFSPEILNPCLKRAVEKSFNCVIVDGDMSTNDCVLITATGKKRISEKRFQEGLDFLCVELAKMIARDGEGSKKFIECRVEGAKRKEEAVDAAKSVVRSPLVKCAINGADPNWGRVVAALGGSSAEVDPERISLGFSDGKEKVVLVKDGKIKEEGFEKAKKILRSKEIVIYVDLGMGGEKASAWGCDLTEDYVRINTKYS